MKTRTNAEKLIEELADKARRQAIFEGSSRNMHPGGMIEDLSDEDREIIQELTSEDMEDKRMTSLDCEHLPNAWARQVKRNAK